MNDVQMKLSFVWIDLVTNALFERPNSHIIFYISKNC